MFTELFAAAMWVAYATRIGLVSFKLQPVMRKIRHGLLPAVIVITATAVGGIAPVHANTAGASVSETAPGARVFRDEVSLDEAVRRAERQYRARVVRTDVQDEDGRKVYVLKLLSEDGRVITVRIDAATGRMR